MCMCVEEKCKRHAYAVWFFGCCFFVYAAVIERALVCVCVVCGNKNIDIRRKRDRRRKKAPTDSCRSQNWNERFFFIFFTSKCQRIKFSASIPLRVQLFFLVCSFFCYYELQKAAKKHNLFFIRKANYAINFRKINWKWVNRTRLHPAANLMFSLLLFPSLSVAVSLSLHHYPSHCRCRARRPTST